MTRETKIGLLVGLAFIIVIGILLSDHLTNSTEPPHAIIANAGSNAMRGVNSPGTANTPANVVAPEIVPTRVPTSEETRKTTPQVAVEVHGSGRPPIADNGNTANNDNGNNGPVVMNGGNNGGNTSGNTAPVPDPRSVVQLERGNLPLNVHEPIHTTTPPIAKEPANLGLGELATKFGDELVGPDGKPLKGSNKPGKSTEYVAKPGDSLSKIAAHFYGTSTKAGREAIIAANPQLKDNQDKIIVDKTYIIPAMENMATVPAPTPTPVPAPLPPTAPVTPVVTNEKTPAAGEYFYTVVEGDSLYHIATDQLGKASAVAAIKELNKDLLKGEDTLHVGMRLRLPGKPIAKAN